MGNPLNKFLQSLRVMRYTKCLLELIHNQYNVLLGLSLVQLL